LTLSPKNRHNNPGAVLNDLSKRDSEGFFVLARPVRRNSYFIATNRNVASTKKGLNHATNDN